VLGKGGDQGSKTKKRGKPARVFHLAFFLKKNQKGLFPEKGPRAGHFINPRGDAIIS